MTIKRFAQSKDDSNPIYWYDVAENTRICCDEETVMKLWCDWVINTNENSIRNDDAKFNIFEYKEPIDVDLNKLEDWTK